MNEPLAASLVEAYVNARELLACALRLVEERPNGRIEDELLSVATDTVIFVRSCARGTPEEFAWKIDQAAGCFHAAQELLRRLRTRKDASQPHVTAALEIAERGGSAARRSARMLALGFPE